MLVSGFVSAVDALYGCVVLACTAEGVMYGARNLKQLIRIDGLVPKATAVASKPDVKSRDVPQPAAAVVAAEIKQDSLAAVFASLKIPEQLMAAFKQEAIEVEHLKLLSEEQLKALLPQMGPRITLQAWIAQKWPQQQPQQPQQQAVSVGSADSKQPAAAGSDAVNLEPKALSEAQVEFTEVKSKSEQFYQLVDQFNASLNGKLDPYVKDRLKKDLPPIAFRVVSHLRCGN
jgi:hypothetical protein